MTPLEARNRRRRPSLRSRIASSLVPAVVLITALPAFALQITIKTTDNPGEGFNDQSPRVPVGGNPGTTLGEQRSFLFQRAAALWGERLEGDQPVIVTASFSALGGSPISATLGFALPTTVHRDFPGAPEDSTWYVAAQANQLAGADQNEPGTCPVARVQGKCPEIETEFNSDVDGQIVLGPVDFYYGLDGNTGFDLDFLSVLLHEIGHGLGVLHLVDSSNGQRFFGFIDAYSARLEDATIAQPKFALMTDAQRVLAMRDDGDLVFKGPAIVEASDALASISKRNDGAVKVFAPMEYIEGSSVAHFDEVLEPDELMEPYLNQPAAHSLDLTVALLEDLGWPSGEVEIICGDFNEDDDITPADALGTLNVSVGLGSCEFARCDVNSSESLTPADALLTLRKSVGQNVFLVCPL